MQGYIDLVQQNGKEDLVRAVYTEGPTHCGFTVSESVAVLETLMHRLETGSWGPTDPEHLNELAASVEDGSVSRFIDLDDEYRVGKYNRAWVPDWAGGDAEARDENRR